jgi:hypothetical protein
MPGSGKSTTAQWLAAELERQGRPARWVYIIRPLDPALVYFRAPDPATVFRAICDKRGMAWTLQHIGGFDGSPWARTRGASGMDGALAYWREHAALCDAAAADAGLRTVTVGPEVGDWAVAPTAHRGVPRADGPTERGRGRSRSRAVRRELPG